MDTRGLGLSKVPVETYQNSLDILVLDAIALMDHLKQDKVIWIGDATWALLGYSLGIRVPERLHPLVVMTAPLRTSDAVLYDRTQDLHLGESIRGEDSIIFMLSKGMRAWADVSVRTRPRMKDAPPAHVEWHIDQISQNDPRLAGEFYRPMPQVDLFSTINDIGVPTLHIDGDRDSALKADHREVLEQIPNVRIVTLEGPGIDIGYARPDACAEQVKAFLRELGLLPL